MPLEFRADRPLGFATILAESLSSSETTLTLVDPPPSIAPGNYLYVILRDPVTGRRELVKATASSGFELTVERGQDTPTYTFSRGAAVYVGSDRKTIIEAIGLHAPSGAGGTPSNAAIDRRIAPFARAGQQWHGNLSVVGESDLADDEQIAVQDRSESEVKVTELHSLRDKMTASWAQPGQNPPSGGTPGTDDQTAAEVPVDASGFTGRLKSTDNSVQKALNTVDTFTEPFQSSDPAKGTPTGGDRVPIFDSEDSNSRKLATVDDLVDSQVKPHAQTGGGKSPAYQVELPTSPPMESGRSRILSESFNPRPRPRPRSKGGINPRNGSGPPRSRWTGIASRWSIGPSPPSGEPERAPANSFCRPQWTTRSPI